MPETRQAPLIDVQIIELMQGLNFYAKIHVVLFLKHLVKYVMVQREGSIHLL